MILFPGGSVGAFSDTQVSLDGLLQQVDLDGVLWSIQSMDGWRMGGGVSTSFTDRPSQHGSFDGPMYRRARVITMQGTAVATSRLLAERACETLAAVLADGSLGTIAVNSPVGVRWVYARLSDTPQAEMTSPVMFRWSLQFTAPDWRKYGVEASASTLLGGGGGGLVWPLTTATPFDFGVAPSIGAVTLVNDGTASSEPILTVSPSLAIGFQLTHVETGRRIRYEAPVTQDMVVDCAEGTVTSGGQDRTGLLTVDEFFSVPAGQSGTIQFASLGSESATDPTTMSAQFAPAYA